MAIETFLAVIFLIIVLIKILSRSNYFTLTGGGKEGLPAEFTPSHNYFTNLKVSTFKKKLFILFGLRISKIVSLILFNPQH